VRNSGGGFGGTHDKSDFYMGAITMTITITSNALGETDLISAIATAISLLR